MNEELACGLTVLSGRIRAHRLLTSDEVAVLTGVSKGTLAQWRSQKRGIPYLKIERAVRYDPADVQTYLV